jgi:acetyltransferase-like isoleucine patch superfamily enzyme
MNINNSKQNIKNVKFGANPIIWDYVNLFDCIFGDNVSIGAFTEIYGSTIGNNVRFQSYCFVPKGTTIEDDVFIAPRVTVLNDKRPPSHGKFWAKVIIKKGASIGGGSIILPGVTIGEGAMIGAGSVVTKNVPAGEVWMGNPAKFYKHKKDL